MGGDDVIDAGADHDMIEGARATTRSPAARAPMPSSCARTAATTSSSTSRRPGAAQGAFDHIAFMDILPEQVTVTDTAKGALVSWDTNGDGTAEASVLLKGVPKADLRQSDFMFNARPGFVAGISTAGSYFILPVAPIRRSCSGSGRIARFAERLGDLLAVFAGVDLDLLRGQVDLDPGFGVDQLHGLRDRAGAVAAAHVRQLEFKHRDLRQSE
jgi:hypothetical protein